MATAEVSTSEGLRSDRRDHRYSQLEQGGGGRSEAPAPGSAWQRWLEHYRKSVWAPVVTKSLAILAGMVALAGIGASSIAHDSGHPLPEELDGGATERQGEPLQTAYMLTHAPKSSPPPAAKGNPPSASAAPSATALNAGSPSEGAAPVSNGTAPSTDSEAPGDDGAKNAETPRPSAFTADGKLILNLATVDDLRKLPGVGQKRAQAIVDLRTKLGGRFRKLADLLRVKGIGVKRLNKLKEQLVLDPPPPPPPS